MNKSNLLSFAIAALIVVFAVGCTTARGYGDSRYDNRNYGYSPYGQYDPYGYYSNSYPVIIESYPRGGRYYGNSNYDSRNYDNRRYNNDYRRQNNQAYTEQREQRQQQQEQQRKEDTRKIDQSRESVLGPKKSN